MLRRLCTPGRTIKSIRLHMFHRATTSASTIDKAYFSSEAASTRTATKHLDSRSTSPLFDRSASSINIMPQVLHPNQAQKPGLLKAIQDDSIQKYAIPCIAKSNTSTPVYFDEGDFDDDLDLTFDMNQESVQKKPPLSSPMTWSASSHLDVKSPSLAHKDNRFMQGESTDYDSEPNSEHATRLVKTESGPPLIPVAPRRARTLPWNKKSPQQQGLVNMQKRNHSSNSALLDDDLENEDAAEYDAVPAKRDPYNMTESAKKAAIKERGKKRGYEEMQPPVFQGDVKPKVASKAEVAKVFLSPEQRGVIELLKTGKSVFFTGSAGTGKSVLLKTAIQELRALHRRMEYVAVTASTGLAACNIGGITLHSFAGVGLGREPVADMVKKVKRNKKNVARWLSTKVLVIDEISMVDAEFFDKLEAVARKLRKNDKPWGGIQVVATGDFFQLPPVPDQGKIAKFAFEAEKWKALDATVQLTTVFRQKDGEFVQMLNQMRTGELSDNTIRMFKSLTRPLNTDDGITPTELFPTRGEVDRANAIRMAQLQGEPETFDAEDTGTAEIQQRSKLLSSCMAPPRLVLKKGAQVMLIKNRDESLVNGSLGVVEGFMDENTYTFAMEGDDDRLVHSLLDSPWTAEEFEAMKATPAGRRKFQKLQDMSTLGRRKFPLVKFKSANGGQEMIQLMCPESWKIEQPNGEIQACRKQVPLILAYAISIHKAQGQTIERVKVDLGKVFEKGQAYVALSRAVSKEGLQVLRFDNKRVMAHPKVATFYRELADASVLLSDTGEKDQGRKTTKLVKQESMVSMTSQEVFSQVKREPMKAYSKAEARARERGRF